MEFSKIIKLPSEIYNEEELELNKINLFFGVNGSGKSHTLKQIQNQVPQSIIIDENRFFISDLIATDAGNINIAYIPSHNNLAKDTVLEEINESFQQIFPNRKLVNISSIGSKNVVISIEKLGKSYSVGSDGRGIWNIIKPLEALVLCNENTGVLIEEFSLGLYPGILTNYYELVKEKILNKNSFLVATTQDPFVVYQFIKNKINDKFEWENTDTDVSLFKFSEDGKGKINIIRLDQDTSETSLKELLGNYLDGIDIHKFSLLFSKPDERISN